MSAVASPQVLIVGAGPAGLVLALCLAKQNIAVRIIEKRTSFPSGRRSTIITPRTMEGLHFLGVAKAVNTLAVGPFPVTRYKMPGGIEPLRTWMMAKPEKPAPDRPYTNFLYLGQDQLEQILRDELGKYSCSVELGSELVSLTQHDHGVEAVIRKASDSATAALDILDVPFVVGADGGNSTTREQLGIPFLRGTRDEEFIIADVRLQGLGGDMIHMWSPGSVTILAWPGSSDLFTLQIAGVTPDRLISEDGYLQQFFVEQTNRTDIEFQEVLSLSVYKPRIGMLSKLSLGRVFLVGDAAHVHTLIGGMGMNSGIQDSMNLGWKLARVIKGQSNPRVLESYNEDRLPIIADMLDKIPELHQSGAVDEAMMRAFESVGLGVTRLKGSQDAWLINYRWSSIVSHDLNLSPQNAGSPASLHAGDRAPNATKLTGKEGTHSLFDLFSCSRDTIVSFQPTLEEMKKMRRLQSGMSQDKPFLVSIFPKDAEVSPDHPADLTLVDTEGYAYAAYGVPNDAKVTCIVRPDGIIGTIVQGAQGIRDYYAKL